MPCALYATDLALLEAPLSTVTCDAFPPDLHKASVDVSPATAMTLHLCTLPTELHAQIFLLLSQGTLLSLLTVTHSLYPEVLRALYTMPSLNSSHAILVFLSVVTQQPAIASITRGLTLTLTHAGTPLYSRTVMEFFWAGLDALRNLQYFTISCVGSPIKVDDAWVLGGHRFPLKAIRNRGMIPVAAVADIIEQYSGTLEIWEQEDDDPEGLEGPFGSMPKLRELGCDARVFVSLSTRTDVEQTLSDLRTSPLESITLHVPYKFDAPNDIEPWTTAIGLFSQSLRVLRIERTVGLGSVPLVNSARDTTSVLGTLAGLGLVHLEKLELVIRGTEDSTQITTGDEAAELARLIGGWSTSVDHDDVGSLVTFCGTTDSGYASRSTSASRSASAVRDSARSRSIEAFARMNFTDGAQSSSNFWRDENIVSRSRSVDVRANRFQQATLYEDEIIGDLSNRSRSVDGHPARYHSDALYEDESFIFRSRSVDAYGPRRNRFCPSFEQVDLSPALAFPSLTTLAISFPRSERRESLHWQTLSQVGRGRVASRIFDTVDDPALLGATANNGPSASVRGRSSPVSGCETPEEPHRGRLRTVGFMGRRGEPTARENQWEWWERGDTEKTATLL